MLDLFFICKYPVKLGIRHHISLNWDVCIVTISEKLIFYYYNCAVLQEMLVSNEQLDALEGIYKGFTISPHILLSTDKVDQN